MNLDLQDLDWSVEIRHCYTRIFTQLLRHTEYAYYHQLGLVSFCSHEARINLLACLRHCDPFGFWRCGG